MMMRMRHLPKRWLVSSVGLAVFLCSQSIWAGPSLRADDHEDRQVAHGGMDILMDGDPNNAIEIFRQIQQSDPQSPLGYLLEAEASWWKIYYATANLLDADLFDVAFVGSTPYDTYFEALINKAVQRSHAQLRSGSKTARSYYYLGMAYALEARLSGLRGDDLTTASAGRKMRANLMNSLQRDPNLADANLGLGIYNFYVDTLPTPLKLLRYLIALPSGNRELGIQELQQAAEKGELTKAEAKFYLAKDFSRDDEKKYGQSLELFDQLATEYPHNPLWQLVSASMRCHLGQTGRCDSLLRKIYLETAGKNSDPDLAVHRAARTALLRQHPNEKFGE